MHVIWQFREFQSSQDLNNLESRLSCIIATCQPITALSFITWSHAALQLAVRKHMIRISYFDWLYDIGCLWWGPMIRCSDDMAWFDWFIFTECYFARVVTSFWKMPLYDKVRIPLYDKVRMPLYMNYDKVRIHRRSVTQKLNLGMIIS